MIRLVAAAAVVLGLLAAYRWIWHGDRDPLVVYCAHDSLYSATILREFERRTGTPVAIRFDTEATKSLGLVELLLREKARPRCDVFWNNEVLGTMALARHGLLEPYRGAGHRRIPARFKDASGHWTGFAARFRVYIVNTDQLEPTTVAIEQVLAGDLGRVAIANPLYGTTLTHYAALWHLWGRERLIDWHRDWRRRGVHEVAGNAAVKSLVARGVCRLGLTDTDDYFAARDGGRPVAMVPVRLESGATICIPNTVAIIRGTPRLALARQLVDFLLSEETECRLAASRARQVPLGAVDPKRLPPDVEPMGSWVGRSVAIPPLAPARDACLTWLKSGVLP